MPIKNIQISQAGLSNVYPSWVYIDTNDTYSQVTTTGYLNTQAKVNLNELSTKMIAVVTTQATQAITANPVVYWFQLQNNSGVWSLIPLSQGALLNTAVTIPTASVLAAYATPYQILPAPGTGNLIIANKAVLYTNFATAAFANGGVGILQYDSTVHGAGTNALSATIPAANITAAASQVYALGGNVGNALTGITNKGLYFSNQTQAFTAGGATTLTVYLEYKIIQATV